MPSGVIASIAYDAENSTLIVGFISGLVYEYKNVPEVIYHHFRKYREKGVYFNRYIKNKYSFEKRE